MEYFLIVDEGTTSTRAMIFDEEGNLISSSNRPLKTIYPISGWVEQSAEEIFSKTIEAIEDAIDQCGCTPSIVGITNQRETVVAWDSQSGLPLYNAIVWRDKRGQAMCERLKSNGYEPVVRAKTGLLIDPYFSASKMSWLIDNVPDVSDSLKKFTLKFGTIDAYLIWKLTGNHLTEPSNASRTMIYNINEMKWDKELSEVFGIPMDSMPEVIDSNGDFGNSKYGKISSVLGDQQSSLLGNMCVKVGDVKCTYGTGAFILANTGSSKNPPSDGLLKTVAWSVRGKTVYAFEGSVLSSGESVNWLKRISLLKDEVEMEALSKLVKSDGIYFIPALDGLGSPRWQPNARSLFLGISSSHTRSNIVRAVLESMAFSVSEVIDTFKKSGLDVSNIKVDGGGSKNSLLIQILSNSTKTNVERSKFHEMTAYGAFLMARIKNEIGEITNLKKDFELFKPKENIDKIYQRWKMAEEISINWANLKEDDGYETLH
ncbi:MAG: FGGY family carbohydrate kinase [Thermotogae bacterium]|jgi:glycerol kinase|nr:FGGY family carbohydrate kinase [Thermotogota bacterium]